MLAWTFAPQSSLSTNLLDLVSLQWNVLHDPQFRQIFQSNSRLWFLKTQSITLSNFQKKVNELDQENINLRMSLQVKRLHKVRTHMFAALPLLCFAWQFLWPVSFCGNFWLCVRKNNDFPEIIILRLFVFQLREDVSAAIPRQASPNRNCTVTNTPADNTVFTDQAGSPGSTCPQCSRPLDTKTQGKPHIDITSWAQNKTNDELHVEQL